MKFINNKKGFAISVVLYAMVILVIGIFYLLLGIVKNRYMVGNNLKQAVISSLGDIDNALSCKDGSLLEKLTLTEPDVDGTRYVYGKVDNNYVWYSGKLWRIVAINSDCSMKLVTQGNMTSIAWNTTQNNDYSTSQVRKWLNNEFLPTLYNADNLLADSTWDYTRFNYSNPTLTKVEPVNTVTEKIGLLTIYEYLMTGSAISKTSSNTFLIDSDTSNTFLNNGYTWWTMSQANSGFTNVWSVTYLGSKSAQDVCSDDKVQQLDGLRPSVNLKSSVEFSGGSGTKSNPYKLKGDKNTGTSSELLSSRVSGEYINFNGVKYRIVGIEEVNGQKLTKVTMADYSVNDNRLVKSIEFASSINGVTKYNTSNGIGKYLYDWYNADDTSSTYADIYIKNIYKEMIATDDIVWYSGPGTSSIDYTTSKSGTTVETPMGLGYYGEIFSSQFGDGADSASNYSNSFYLMTMYQNGWFWAVTFDSKVHSNGSFGGVRPSFYLKSDVIITGGSGMPHNPYEIAQN